MDPELCKAAAEGNIEPFKEITEQLDLIVTPIKNTILHINIKSQIIFMVSTVFIEQILDICPSLSVQVNGKGDTPLLVAATCGHSAVVDLLIKHAKAQHEDVESGVRSARQMLRMTNGEGNTALHEAVQNQWISVVKILTEEDPDFSCSPNNCGETPLYMAAAKGDSDIVNTILENCTSLAHQGPNGRTALHEAVMNNDFNMASTILNKSKRLSMSRETDQYGWTPLHYAVYYGHFQIASLLLEFDASAAYIPDNVRKMTVLHIAASRGYIELMENIIIQCPDCYQLVDNRGWNIIHFAMVSLRNNQLKIVLDNLLLAYLLYDKDVNGNTPLHVLAACRPDSFQYITSWILTECDALDKRKILFKAVGDHDDDFPELKQEILELSKDIGTEPYLRGVIIICNEKTVNYDFKEKHPGVIHLEMILEQTREESERTIKQLENKLAQVQEAKDSHLVVAALIATVTFAAAFTLPGGYKSEQGPDYGTAILSRNAAFQAFMITDAIAMVLSLSAVFVHFIIAMEKFKRYVFLFQYALWFTVIAMGAMVIAFITGTYAVLTASLWLALVTCFIGLSFFLVLILMVKKTGEVRIRPWWKEKDDREV